MTQTIILNNLAQFVEYMGKEHDAQLEEELQSPDVVKRQRIEKQREELHAYTRNLKQLLEDGGHCFGFSLTFGAMRQIGKLDWWVKALRAIATWDGNLSSLEREMVHHPKQTLKDIFNRVLNYVVMSHALEGAAAIFPDIDQFNILKPDAHNLDKPDSKKDSVNVPVERIRRSYFELVDNEAKKGDGPIKTIKTRKKIAGHFTRTQLKKLLGSVSSLKNSIILVHCIDHTICISYKKPTWNIYDPNYDHKRKNIIYKTNKILQCADEIRRILGDSIAIEIASFDKNVSMNFPEYDRLIRESPLTLLDNDGFRMLSESSPKTLITAMQNIPVLEKPIFLKKMAVTMGKIVSDRTLLQAVARDAPDALFLLLQFADGAKEEKHVVVAILLAMAYQNAKQWTGLHFMAFCAPKALLNLIEIMNRSIQRENYLTIFFKILPEQTNRQKTGLHFMACCSPEALL